MRLIAIGVFALSLLLSGCMNESAANTSPSEEVVKQYWNGDFPVTALRLLPEGQQKVGVGYIANPEVFLAVWSMFKPGETVPNVDFKKNMVVFVRNTHFYNRNNILDMKLKDGVLDVITMETMSALPIEDKVAMVMTVVSRNGIKFIQSGSTLISVESGD